MLVRLAAVAAAVVAVAVVVAAAAAAAAEGAGRRADRTCLLQQLSCKALHQQSGAPGGGNYGLWAMGSGGLVGFRGFKPFTEGQAGTHKGHVCEGISGNYSIDSI